MSASIEPMPEAASVGVMPWLFGRSTMAPCSSSSLIAGASCALAARNSGVVPTSASDPRRDRRRSRDTAADSFNCGFGFAPFSSRIRMMSIGSVSSSDG